MRLSDITLLAGTLLFVGSCLSQSAAVHMTYAGRATGPVYITLVNEDGSIPTAGHFASVAEALRGLSGGGGGFGGAAWTPAVGSTYNQVVKIWIDVGNVAHDACMPPNSGALPSCRPQVGDPAGQGPERPGATPSVIEVEVRDPSTPQGG